MKPLQNQYQDLLEGKMSKFNFLTNIKRTLPDLVSNITSLEDAVKILKNKRILSESIHNTPQMGGVTTSKGTAGYINNPDKKGGDYDPKARAANLAKLANFGLKKEEEDDKYSIYLDTHPIYTNIPISRLKSVLYSLEKELGEDLEDYIVLKNSNNKTKPANELGWDLSNVSPFDNIESLKSKIKQIENLNEEDNNYDFIKNAIESASGDKVEKREEDEEGNPLYWSLSNDSVNYYIGSDEQIIKYNGETGERYPIGELEHYKNSPDDKDYDEEIVNRYEREQEKHALPGGNIYESVEMPANLIADIDKVNPLEYNTGLDYELDLSGDFSAESLVKCAKKVVKNLKKNPIYYTNLKAELTQKINNKKVISSEYTELKKDNQVDKLNQLKSIVKKEIANTKTSLSKQEKASKAMPKGVKLMKESQYTYKYKIGDIFKVKNLQKDPDPIYKDVKVGDEIKITKVWSNLAGPVYGTNISEKTGLNEKDIAELTSSSMNEVKIEDIKALLSNETLKKSDIGNSNDGVSIIYDDYKELPYKDKEAISSRYKVDADKLSDEGETEVWQYYISDKMNEIMKPDSKSKLKEIIRKITNEMMKEDKENNTELSAANVEKIIKNAGGARAEVFNNEKGKIEDLKDGNVYVRSEVSGIYRLVGDALRTLESHFNVEERYEDHGDREEYIYIISPKTSKPASQNKPVRKPLPNDNIPIEDIFENDDKARQEKDFSNFSKKMIGKKTTAQNTIKTKIKEYVVKHLKKEAVKFTIGASGDKVYKPETGVRAYEDELKAAGVKFTKSKA